jgi:two-component system OmpR family sensor kinase
MFSSLRARLWLTYSLVSGITLLLVAAGFLIYVARSPLLYRQTGQTLHVADEVIAQRFDSGGSQAGDTPLRALQRAQDLFKVRFLLYSGDGGLIADSQPAVAPIVPSHALKDISASQLLTFREPGGRAWLYVVRALKGGDYLLAATPRPVLPIMSFLRDDLVAPVLRVGLVTLLLAFLLAFLMARWIAAPLQRMASAAQAVAAGQYHPIPPEGPAEEKALALAFNEMTHKVQSSQQSQRDFVANVSHELKTPLTSIQGFSQAILDGTASTPEALLQAGEVIHSEAERMNRLVLDLLALARLEAGTADLQRAPMDLSALLKRLVERFAPQARQAGIELQLEADSTPTITGDGDRLMQVFNNLVDNAIKFTPSGGKVALRSYQENGQVVVSVADTGIGLAPEEKERIFERFYQADRSRPGGLARGAGLGLAIAREIVHAHGGSISVTSQPGKGSIFIVRLPIAAKSESPSENASA